MKRLLLILFSVGFSLNCLLAQEKLEGLSLSVGAGMMFANPYHSNFYNGSEGNVNTINRVLHSQTYGENIWYDLFSQGLIGSSIQNYQQLNVVEYGDMYYKMAVQLDFGVRYDYSNGLGWILHFDYSKLDAIGAFNIWSGHSDPILSNVSQYVTCPIVGEEKRINIDLGLAYHIPMGNSWSMECILGGNLNNTKVLSNDMKIGNGIYNILDIWSGMNPSYGTVERDYINQGGIGYGGFVTIGASYTLPGFSAISAGYTFYYTKISLLNYEAFKPQHLVYIRFDLNNFSFL